MMERQIFWKVLFRQLELGEVRKEVVETAMVVGIPPQV